MADSERIRSVLVHCGLSANAFGRELGLRNSQTVYDLLNGRHGISKDMAVRITARYPELNMSWLLTGEGSMLKTKRAEANGSEFNVCGYMSVPVIPVRARAGYLLGYADTEYVETLDTIPVLVDKKYHGQYRCFEIEGDSMDDDTRRSLCDRDIVLGRELQRHLWSDKLHLRQWPVWVIVHRTDGILIKEIVDHNKDTGDIVCHSWNELYAPDFVINLSEVEELYNVIRIVDRALR